jgi:hypothetical protein
MNRDRAGACTPSGKRGFNRLGIADPARLTQRNDVIDVHPELGHGL